MADPGSASSNGSFKDRSARLVVFGVVAVGVGLLSFGFGLLQTALIFFRRLLPEAGALTEDVSILLMGTAFYWLIGAVFVVCGIGSIRKRRWVRTLMLTLAWSWLACGTLVAILAPGMLDTVLVSTSSAAPVEAMVAVRLFLLAMIGFGGVLLPATFVWAYNDRDVARTCVARNSRPAWTERAPAPVVGLSVGLAACGVAALPMLLRPVVPAFNVVLTGWPAGCALLTGAAVCVYLARSTYRLESSGWWGTVGLMLLIGVATAVAFNALEPVELYRALGYPESTIHALGNSGSGFGRIIGWIAAAVTFLSLVYMASLRKHFTGRGPDSKILRGQT